MVHYFYQQNQMLLQYFVLLLLIIMNHHYDDQLYWYGQKQIHNLQVLHQVLIEKHLKNKILDFKKLRFVYVPCE